MEERRPTEYLQKSVTFQAVVSLLKTLKPFNHHCSNFLRPQEFHVIQLNTIHIIMREKIQSEVSEDVFIFLLMFCQYNQP